MFGLNMWIRPFAGQPTPEAAAYLNPSFPASPWMLLAGRMPHGSPPTSDKNALTSGPHHQFPLNAEAIAVANEKARQFLRDARRKSPLASRADADYASAFLPPKRARHEDSRSPAGSSPRAASSPQSVQSLDSNSEPEDLRATSSPRSAIWRPDVPAFSSDEAQIPCYVLQDGRVRCPVCGEELPVAEVSSHFSKEMETFHSETQRSSIRMMDRSPEGSSLPTFPCSPPSPSGARYETFVKIRNNRQDRLRVKARLRRKCELADPSDLDKSEVASEAGEEDAEIDVVSDRQVDRESKTCAEQMKMQCFVCKSSLKEPLASLQCWHVHCHSCWLRAFSTNHECPRCRAPASPSELRKILI